MSRKEPGQAFGRIVLGIVGIFIILFGAGALSKGHLGYENYWGGFVYGPIAIVIGLLVILAALRGNLQTKKLRGREARLARKADETKFPIDTYRKW
jgi:hypothetical protein